MPNRIINFEDAEGFVSPEDPAFYDEDGDPIDIAEGIQNHAYYHTVRPGECGRGCPGLLEWDTQSVGST